MTKYFGESAIIAKLMLFYKCQSSNLTLPGEYRRVAEFLFAIVWTKASACAQSEHTAGVYVAVHI